MKTLKRGKLKVVSCETDCGVSEILGTVLLLAISIALFSALYLMMQNVLVAENPPVADLVGYIDGDTVFIEHHGGNSLPASVSISVSIGGEKNTIDFDETFDENNNRHWDIGERVSFTETRVEEEYFVDVSVVDRNSNNAIYLGMLKEGSSIDSEPEIPDDSSPIIAWWHFDEQSGSVAFDATQNDNHGSLSLTSWIDEGNNLSCLWFNGENSSIAVERDAHPELDPTERLTMMAWVKNTDVDDNYLSNIVCRSGGSDEYSYALYLNDGLTNDNIGVQVRTETGGVQNKEWEWTEINGSWFHVAASFSNENNGTIVLYHNGQQVASWNDVGTNLVYRTEYDNDQVYIGSGPLYTSNYFKGLLDEVILFNDTLSSQEIHQFFLQTAPTPLLNQRAEWCMNENSGSIVFDSSGNNNHGIIHDAEWTQGINESGLSFDGASCVKVNESNSLNIDEDQLTLEAWVKWNETPSNADDWANILFKETDRAWGPHYQLQHDQNNEHFEFTISTIESDNAYLWSTTEVQKDVWYYVVGTYDGSEMKIYVNGSLENTKNVHGNFITSTKPVYLGCRSGIERFFNGIIDEVSIYNYVLTPSQIIERYNQTIENYGSVTNLVSYWKLDENSGTTAFDSIGPNDAVIDSTSWIDGIHNSGLLFDDQRDSLSVDSSESLRIRDDMSISFWFNVDSLPSGSDDALFTYTANGESEQHNTLYELFLDSSGDLTYKHEYDNGIDQTFTFDANILASSWYHLVLTRDSAANQVTVYLNNVEIGSFTYTTPPTGGESSKLYLGSDRPNQRRAFNGIMDEIRLYTGVLSTSEIEELFNEFNTQQSGLISYWEFNENSGSTAFDTVGSNHGTIYDATWTTGLNGSCLSFDGDHDYVTVFDDNSLDLSTSGTIEVWVNIDSYQSFAGIVHKGEETDFSDEAYTLQFWNSPGSLRFAITDENNDMAYVDSSSLLELNTWYHIVATWNESSLSLFINGELDNSESNTITTVRDSNGALQIGSQLTEDYNSNYGVFGFDGLIETVKLHHLALSTEEINQSYLSNKPSDELNQENMLAYWKLNENSGTTTADSIGSNDGSLQGATWTTGKDESGLHFDGSQDEYVTIPYDNSISLDHDFSVSFWIYPTDETVQWKTILSRSNQFTCSYIGNDEIRVHINGYANIDSQTSAPRNTWTHVVFTYKNTDAGDDEIVLYINGEYDGQVGPTWGTPNTPSNPLIIGGDLSGSYYTGSLDEIIIYDKSLSAEEVTAIYNYYD